MALHSLGTYLHLLTHTSDTHTHPPTHKHTHTHTHTHKPIHKPIHTQTNLQTLHLLIPQQAMPSDKHRLPAAQQVQLGQVDDLRQERKVVRDPVRIRKSLRFPVVGHRQRRRHRRRQPGLRRGDERARNGVRGRQV